MSYDEVRIAEVRQVVHVRLKRGTGATEDPVRLISQFWSFEGELLAEQDPCCIPTFVGLDKTEQYPLASGRRE